MFLVQSSFQNEWPVIFRATLCVCACVRATAMVRSLTIPPQLKRVATLPCKYFGIQKLTSQCEPTRGVLAAPTILVTDNCARQERAATIAGINARGASI